ncbi:unnamed protein product [Coffea canephora]|uniref:Sulfotransferase n=1 Tax=Coffea canephora TaxID=49390 RepID=A0A068UV62_COFCA|nr:unnamed protein product [Coffea canephora]
MDVLLRHIVVLRLFEYFNEFKPTICFYIFCILLQMSSKPNSCYQVCLVALLMMNCQRPDWLEGAIAAKSDFQAQDDDVLLSSQPKSGTTWLKALVVSIMDNYAAHTTNNINDAMNKTNKYDLLTIIQIFTPAKASASPIPCPTVRGRPRLYQTHVPYGMLSKSIKTSGCKIVYITRDLKDVMVSLWHFCNANNQSTEEPYPMEDAFESFCKGVHTFGPFHDHLLGYWRECLARPDKILFLRYEDLKKNPSGEVSKLASFLGCPFASKDEADRTIYRCSLERLKTLQVNMEGIKNHFTPEMKEHFNEITRKKFRGSGLDMYYS